MVNRLCVILLFMTVALLHYFHWILWNESVCRAMSDMAACDSKPGNPTCHDSHLLFNKEDPCNLQHLLDDAFTLHHLRMFQENCDLVWYPRCPKSGSTTLTHMFKAAPGYPLKLCHKRFKGTSWWTKPHELENETKAIVSTQGRPCLIDPLHHFFVPFKKYNLAQPLIINMVRQPISRLISHHLFMSFKMGKQAEDLLKNNATFKGTLLDCALGRNPLKQCNAFFGYFCEHESICRPRGQDALNLAMSNIENYGMIVGLTEDLEGFLEVLELLSPTFFKNSREFYNQTKETSGRVSSNTSLKKHLMLNTSEVMQLPAILDTEIQLYMFIRQRFYRLKKKLLKLNR